MESIFAWVKSIVIFLIILTFVNELLPSKDYQKYVRVSGGMILMMIVIWPVLDWLGNGKISAYIRPWDEMKSSLKYEAAPDFLSAVNEGAIETYRFEAMLGSYIENIRSQAEEMLLYEGYRADRLEIKAADQEILHGLAGVEAIDIYGIERVNKNEPMMPKPEEIDVETVSVSAKTAAAEQSSAEENLKLSASECVRLKERLSQIFGVDRSRVHIR